MGQPLPLLAPAGLGVVALAWGAHALAGERPPEPSPAARTAEDPAAPGLVLPDGAVARAGLSGPETQPAALPGEWSPALGPGCWDDDRGPATWGTWVQLVHQASNGAAEERPRARAGLALLAAADAQPQVAWGHAAALAESPRWTATRVPRLLPGVPLDHPLGPGGSVEPLAPGTHLRPPAPPRPRPPVLGNGRGRRDVRRPHGRRGAAGPIRGAAGRGRGGVDHRAPGARVTTGRRASECRAAPEYRISSGRTTSTGLATWSWPRPTRSCVCSTDASSSDSDPRGAGRCGPRRAR